MVATELQQIHHNVFVGPRCHEQSVRGLGNTEYGVMVIGVAPGKDELKSGKPLTGPTGQIFDVILKAVGFPRSQVYVTNMCCWYVSGKIKRADMDKCHARLHNEILMVRPKLIIILGTEVCEYWTGYTISKARGAALWNTEYNCYVMPVIQPAALFHSGDVDTSNAATDKVSNVAYDIVRDLRKIPEILSWPTDGSRSNVEYTVCETTAEAQSVLDSLPRDCTVALDVETNAKMMDVIDIKKDALICLAVSAGGHSWVFPVHVCAGLNWPDDIRWGFHSASFDTSIVHRDLGVWLQVHEDSMLQSYTCDERPGYHGLKPLAREFEGSGFYETKRIKGNLPAIYEYNAYDAAYTARLANGKLRQWQDLEGTRAVYDKLLIPATNVFKEMQDRGARVDAKLLRRLEDEWGNEIETELASMQEMAYAAGWPVGDINLNSPTQLSKLLYGVIGLSGGPSTNKQNLERLQGEHPFVDALSRFRSLQRNYDTYVEGFVEHIRVHGLDHGRVHPYAMLHGTVTGRRAYRNPPVQTIPRPSNNANKYGLLRRAFIPTNDDYEIAYVDYSRAEIYTAFGYSHDPVMWEALQKDYHLETAVNVMHKDRAMLLADEDYREEMRRIAKIVTFGIFYGMEAYSLATIAGISVSEASEYIESFFASNKEYAKFYQRTLTQLQATGEIESLTGRKRRFVLLQDNPRALKQAVNFPVQSTAGDLTLTAMIKLHPMLKQYDTHIMFDVHDAIVFEVSKKHKHVALPLIKEVMESKLFAEYDPDFPSVPVELYCGRSWGHAQKIKDVYNIGSVVAA